MKALIAAGVVAAAAVGTTVAVATSDNETPITGNALERAKEAALDHVGEGRVTDTEVGDEESYYEVEITREDGGEVDVQLDEGFNVVGSEDEDGETEDDESDDN